MDMSVTVSLRFDDLAFVMLKDGVCVYSSRVESARTTGAGHPAEGPFRFTYLRFDTYIANINSDLSLQIFK